MRDTGSGGEISIGSLDVKPEEQDSRRLIETLSGAVYVPSSDSGSGQLLFRRRGALMAQPFDPRRLKMVSWDTRILLSSGYRIFSHPEICSGDQSRISLLATILCNLPLIARRHSLGREADSQAS